MFKGKLIQNVLFGVSLFAEETWHNGLPFVPCAWSWKVTSIHFTNEI